MRRVAMIGVLLVFLAVVIAPTMRSYLSQRSQVAQLRAQVAAQQTNVASLQKTERNWSDPKYVEAQAGARLGFVKPGQTLTIYVTDAKAAATEAKKSKDHQTWYGTMWQSVVASGAH